MRKLISRRKTWCFWTWGHRLDTIVVEFQESTSTGCAKLESTFNWSFQRWSELTFHMTVWKTWLMERLFFQKETKGVAYVYWFHAFCWTERWSGKICGFGAILGSWLVWEKFRLLNDSKLMRWNDFVLNQRGFEIIIQWGVNNKENKRDGYVKCFQYEILVSDSVFGLLQ